MPKPCFQTIQASGIFRIFEQCGISGVRIPHALDSAGTLGPALRGFPSIQWEVGQLLWVREEGGVGKLGPPCDISVGGALFVSPLPASQDSPATPMWPQVTSVQAVPLLAGCH